MLLKKLKSSINEVFRCGEPPGGVDGWNIHTIGLRLVLLICFRRVLRSPVQSESLVVVTPPFQVFFQT